MFDGTAPQPALRVGLLALGGVGGSSEVAWSLARGLPGLSCRTVMFSHPEAAWRDDGQNPILHPVRVPLEPCAAEDGWIEPLCEDLVAALRQHPLDVLSVHFGVGLAEAALAARDRLETGSPRVCVTVHGTDVSRLAQDEVQRGRLERALGRADGWTAVSQWLGAAAAAHLRVRSAPRVILNGVDTHRFRPSDLATDEGVVAHVSNFRSVKRPLDSLEVFARLYASGHAKRLWMAGEGPLRAQAQARAVALGLADAVEFTGVLDPEALAGRLRRASVLLVTSETESSSLVALEALASGVVPVVSDCDGLRELMASSAGLGGRNLAPVGAIEAFAARARLPLSTPSVRETMRACGLELVKTRYDRSRQLACYAALFHQLAQRAVP